MLECVESGREGEGHAEWKLDADWGRPWSWVGCQLGFVVIDAGGEGIARRRDGWYERTPTSATPMISLHHRRKSENRLRGRHFGERTPLNLGGRKTRSLAMAVTCAGCR